MEKAENLNTRLLHRPMGGTRLQRELDLAEVEQALKEINEVEAARIILGDNSTVEEVHIIALPGRGPKYLVRDVESTLIAKFGLAIDHKKISIAQVGGVSQADGIKQSESSPVSAVNSRPQIVSVGTEAIGPHTKVSVVLSSNGEKYEGLAEGPSTGTGRLRLIALATLEAIEKLARIPYSLALEDVVMVRLGRQEVLVACISMVKPEGEESFSGSAIVGQKGSDMVVRATLDAINRRFGILKTS